MSLKFGLRNHTSPQTPPTRIFELEKPIPVIDKNDDAALASLKGHPGITALLNRFKLQKAVLTQKLCTTEFKNLNDVYLLQSRLLGVGYAQRQIEEATKNLEVKKERPATSYEVDQFENILSAIESVRPTTADDK